MTIDGEGNKITPELNNCAVGEAKLVEDGAMGEVEGALNDNELRSNGVYDNVEDDLGQAMPGTCVMQVPQQPSQGSSVICWERFLPVRSIKVLLVENDDSTRHVVTALLRNCNYEVVEAANGLQAWRILEDLTNHIDLVLTEVVMPSLSGVGLLCKIMNHKTRKNVPVIMMSSHDSMGLVFKCLSKGAVDFWVKPIRKNELKNLWQHVWRRCHSSSGSGSESGTQTQKSTKSGSTEKSDNNSGSNDGEDNGSPGLDVGDGSDNGSGTQSSWTKQALEADSSHSASPWHQITEYQDSTCARVIQSNAETFGKSGNLEQHENPIGVTIGATVERSSKANCMLVEKGPENCSAECPSNTHKAVNLFDHQIVSREIDSPRDLANVIVTNKPDDDLKEQTAVELSLKRLRGVEDPGKTIKEDRNVIRRSELSAFSRYTSTSNAFKPPSGMTGSRSLLDNSLEVKKESGSDVRSHAYKNHFYLSTNGISNNIDMESTTDKLSTNPLVLKDKLEATSTINGLYPSSAFKPSRNECSSRQVMPVKADEMAVRAVVAPQIGLHQDIQLQHIHHHHFHNMEQKEFLSNNEDMSLKKLAADAPHCGSSNVVGGLVAGNPENCSLSRSASGSNNGSNGQNGSNSAVNTGGTNIESDAGAAGKSGSGDVSRNKIDPNKSAHREAALNKFRQKRKERCFRKKVRYQNRKKLAEQRPRVRGQFVRKTGHKDSNVVSDG